MSSRIIHCILHGWVYTPEDIVTRGAQIEVVSESLLPRDDSDWQSVIEDTLCGSDPFSITPRELVSRIILSLRSKSKVDYPRHRCFLFLHAVPRFAPSIPASLVGNRWGPGLVATMFVACQRQLSLGETPYSVAVTQLCLRAYWSVLCADQIFSVN